MCKCAHIGVPPKLQDIILAREPADDGQTICLGPQLAEDQWSEGPPALSGYLWPPNLSVPSPRLGSVLF